VVTTLAGLGAALWLTAIPVTGQVGGSKLPMRPYGQLAGCSEMPAELHPCALAKAKTFNPPRTRDGAPDFQGFWGRARVTSDNIEEHAEVTGDPGGVSLVIDPPDGKIPYQPWALAQRKTNVDGFISPQAACFLPGVPRQAYTPGGGYQILQTPGYVMFLLEYSHVYRIIPLDGRPHVGPAITLGMGDSRGRWEGNTLVVDARNHSAKTWYDNEGNFFSDAMRAVERWTMFDADAMLYEVTIEDPKVYTRPLTIAFGIQRNSNPRHELLESACWEGDRNLQRRLKVGDRIYFGVTPP
jgi:hypothetical protein